MCLLSFQVPDIITWSRICILGRSYRTSALINNMGKCSFTEILRLKVCVTIIYFVKICYFFIVNFPSFLFVEQKTL